MTGPTGEASERQLRLTPIMPFMMTPITRTRPQRGSMASDQPRNFARNPGLTVVRRPKAASALRATISGVAACPICMPARAAKPVPTGPGATDRTLTPWGRISAAMPSAKLCTKPLVAA
jgi:hypothetical protein